MDKQTETDRETDKDTTVKPFNLAAQKVGDLACKIILAPLFWRIKTIQFEIL